MTEKIEQIILGTIMTYGDLQDIIVNSLTVDMFYQKEHRIIFATIKKLHLESKPADMLTVVNELQKADLQAAGGGYYISTLNNNVGSAWDYENGIKILKQEYIKRGMLTLFQCETASLLNNDKDIAEIYSNVNTQLQNLFNITDTNVLNMYDVMSERITEIEKIKPDKLIGVPSGIKKLDNITGGWQSGDMIVLAARPSMGKTAVSLLFAKYPVLNGFNVLYFSLEMSKERLADRVISLDTGINSKKLQANNLYSNDWIQIEENVIKYKDSDFLINDQSGLTIEEISNIALIESKKKDIDIVIIDYLQLIKFSKKSGNTNDHVTHISKNIKALAKKLKCPVIALSQLSRGVENRGGDKRPMLSDLRDSGSIEQDADIVMFLYRPAYYYDEPENKGIIEMLIQKHRNGELAMTKIYHNDSWSSIRDEEISEIPDFDEMQSNF